MWQGEATSDTEAGNTMHTPHNQDWSPPFARPSFTSGVAESVSDG